jgi:internalin A
LNGAVIAVKAVGADGSRWSQELSFPPLPHRILLRQEPDHLHVVPKSPQSAKLSADGAIAEIRKLGGVVTIDDNSPGKPVVSAVLDGPNFTNAGMKYLKGLTQLQSLHLSDTRVTDVGLAHVKGLTQLQSLDLGGAEITDAGLVHLIGLTQLQSLSLAFTKVTDSGLARLKTLAKLQTLNLYGDTALGSV